MYKSNPQTIDDLKISITNAIKSISKETLSRVFKNMKKRAEKCIEMNGEHFEHILT